MKATQSWNYERYRPAVCGKDTIYLCRVVPLENQIELFWKSETADEFNVCWRKKGCDEAWKTKRVCTKQATICDLENGIDYEFYVCNKEEHSAIGYARPGDVPGTVVNYLHPEDPKYAFSGQHLCSPCLLKHPDGYLLASMDVFEGGSPQNLTLIFRSDDEGTTWYHYSELFPCFWGSLFMHQGNMYMLGTTTEYGDLLIGKSEDGGKSFCVPTVLFRGSCHSAVPGWHRAPMPILEAHGRLWTGIDYGSHPSGGHASCLLSADMKQDLLDPKTWVMSEPLTYSSEWEGAVQGDHRGFIEGNAVILPDGGVGNFLRYFTDRGTPNYGLAPILRGDPSDPEKALTFERFVEFPGNLSKFEIHWDAIGKRYYSIVSRVWNPDRPITRNLLSLVSSKDLEHWELEYDLLDYSHLNARQVGFQYVSFLFDGDDLLYLCRTAFNGAQSYHDNNYITFHRVQNFRKIT